MEKQEASMAGKVCLITGATAGIGEATARELAHRGATVVLVGRNRARCEAVADSIRRSTGNPSVEFLLADLSSQAEVRRLAQEFLRRHDRLHVLVNNAGALFALRRESADGIEMTLALNHLAYFLLTGLLLKTLKESAPARIVNVSSRAHHDVPGIDFDDPQATGVPRPKSYGTSEWSSLFYCLFKPWAHPGFAQYAQTKLANVLFTLELAKRLEGSGVTANALDPGFVATQFTAGNGSLGWFMRLWSNLSGLTPEEGARTSIYLASSTEVEGVSGKYFARCAQATPSTFATDPVAMKKLWELSERLTGGAAFT